MPPSLGYTDEAVADLTPDGVGRQAGSGTAAVGRLRAIRLATRNLKLVPYLGAGGQWPGTREVTSAGHRIIHEVAGAPDKDGEPARIVVLRVFGPGHPVPSRAAAAWATNCNDPAPRMDSDHDLG